MKNHVLKVRVDERLHAELEAEAVSRMLPVSAIVRERLLHITHPFDEVPREEEGRVEVFDDTPYKLKDAPAQDLPNGAIVSVRLDDPGESIVTPVCSHPVARQRNVVGGKKCLACGEIKKLNGTWQHG
jgi:hypothetical protein